MQKFTPGPWRHEVGIVIADIPNGDTKTTAVAYVGDEFRHVGGLCFGDERDANARLISAAPELYAALKELAAAYDNYDGGSISEKRIQAAVDGAESALAKATGA